MKTDYGHLIDKRLLAMIAEQDEYLVFNAEWSSLEALAPTLPDETFERIRFPYSLFLIRLRPNALILDLDRMTAESFRHLTHGNPWWRYRPSRAEVNHWRLDGASPVEVMAHARELLRRLHQLWNLEPKMEVPIKISPKVMALAKAFDKMGILSRCPDPPWSTSPFKRAAFTFPSWYGYWEDWGDDGVVMYFYEQLTPEIVGFQNHLLSNGAKPTNFDEPKFKRVTHKNMLAAIQHVNSRSWDNWNAAEVPLFF